MKAFKIENLPTEMPTPGDAGSKGKFIFENTNCECNHPETTEEKDSLAQ